MTFVVDPETGRLVSTQTDKALIDSRLRVLVPIGDRAISTTFGSTLFDAISGGGGPDDLAVLQASVQAALSGSPFYEVLRVTVDQTGDVLLLEVTLKLPDGTVLVVPMTAPAAPVTPPNQPPTVQASAAAMSVNGGGTIALTAVATDPEGGNLVYAWVVTGGSVDDPAAAQTDWQAPAAADINQTFEATVTVTDEGGLQVTDTVQLMVNANQPPTVQASAAAMSVNGGGTIALTAVGGDPEGLPLTYGWVSNGGGTFDDAAAAMADWTAPDATSQEQAITLTVTVTDNLGLQDTATVDVTVNAALGVFEEFVARDAYVVDFTAEATGEEIWEFDPASGTLHQSSPAGMYTDPSVYWIERVRVREIGARVAFHRGASSVDTQTFAATWTDDWGVYIYDVASGQYVILQANMVASLGGSFVSWESGSWVVIAETFAADLALALDDLNGRRVIVALCPTSDYRPA